MTKPKLYQAARRAQILAAGELNAAEVNALHEMKNETKRHEGHRSCREGMMQSCNKYDKLRSNRLPALHLKSSLEKYLIIAFLMQWFGMSYCRC